jgi:hypothetical protein
MLLASACLNWYTSWLLVEMSRATGADSVEVRHILARTTSFDNLTFVSWQPGAYLVGIWKEI